MQKVMSHPCEVSQYKSSATTTNSQPCSLNPLSHSRPHLGPSGMPSTLHSAMRRNAEQHAEDTDLATGRLQHHCGACGSAPARRSSAADKADPAAKAVTASARQSMASGESKSGRGARATMRAAGGGGRRLTAGRKSGGCMQRRMPEAASLTRRSPTGAPAAPAAHAFEARAAQGALRETAHGPKDPRRRTRSDVSPKQESGLEACISEPGAGAPSALQWSRLSVAAWLAQPSGVSHLRLRPDAPWRGKTRRASPGRGTIKPPNVTNSPSI